MRDVFWLGPPAPKRLGAKHAHYKEAGGQAHLESRCCVILIYNARLTGLARPPRALAIPVETGSSRRRALTSPVVTESSVDMRVASGCEEGVAEAERGAVPFPCCVLLPPYAESSSAAHAAATCCLASADPLGYRRNAYSTTHAPTSAIILRGSGSSGSREHTALSDQGGPSTYTHSTVRTT